MNLSSVVSSIKSQLGLHMITLPFTDPVTKSPTPTENVIRDILVTTTIPEFSQFAPWVKEGDCEIRNLKAIDHRKGIYYLPAFLTLTPVMYVVAVDLPMHNTRGTYGDVSPAYGISRSVEGVITSQTYMMLASQMRAEPTFEYLGENKIQLYGYPNCMLTFKVACQHESNGESIDEGYRDSFMELAELDVKKFLYHNLKYYDGLPSAFGEVKLKIEEFQGAEAERKALLDDWRNTFHLDMGWEHWM